jgi:hypothetical protein
MAPQYKPGDEVVYKPVGGTVFFFLSYRAVLSEPRFDL